MKLQKLARRSFWEYLRFDLDFVCFVYLGIVFRIY